MVRLSLLMTASLFANAGAPPSNVAAALQPYVDRHILAGAVTMVGTKDRTLDLAAVGFADIASRRLMTADSVFWIASMTKPMTAAAFMMLVDEGKVSENDPVGKYMPEFNQIMVRPPEGEKTPSIKASHPLLIRELLSHNSGMGFSSPEDHEPFDRLSLAERVITYAKTPLLSQPGTAYHYSNAGTNTVGRIIEIVSGMSYEKFLDVRLLQPLGMKDTTFWPNPGQIARLPTVYKADEAKTGLVPSTITQLTAPYDNPARTPLPAGGLFSTAPDVMKFMQMIAAEGLHEGKRLLSANAIAQMTRRETSVLSAESYGFGWRVETARVGHGGVYRTGMFLTPKTGLITVFLVQQNGAWPADGDAVIAQTFERTAEKMALP